MRGTNDHDPKRAILYARVSTDEQARSGYSLAQQMEALRDYAVREGYEILEEVSDSGQSGASLERPGMDRVRDLVAAGDVSVVLAQDRDRFAREPAYHYLLRREFEEQGTKIRALNDRGDDSPEGELTDGILDQLAKFERAKTAERTRRGKLRRAREGKVVPTHTPDYGFEFNDSCDNYVVVEAEMAVVWRIFRMIGVEGMTMHAVKKTFEREGIPAPGGGDRWDRTFFRACVLDDVYKPHTFAEIKELVLPEVTARLDPDTNYGVWWFNRRRRRRTRVSESGPNGRSYRWRSATVIRPQDEWIAVPVPDCGIPREWVNAAREVVKHNRRPSSNGLRFWELSGEILFCGGCGRTMATHAVYGSGSRSKTRLFYYRCNLRKNEGVDACEQAKHYRAGEMEARVWRAVSGILKDPEQLRADLEQMIKLECEGRRGDPEREAKGWLDKLGEVDRKRSGFQEMAAEGVIAFDELRAKLAALDATRATAERELEAIKGRREHLEKLERDKETLLETYAALTPEALESLTPEERQKLYKMLRLRVIINLDETIEVGGMFVDNLDVCTVEVSS
ncbi:MAG TPA: recombinase family protein [Rubrobacteraceae bacterium]|nr:recombinase family protein [Rubrobacteraceae bacterium]